MRTHVDACSLDAAEVARRAKPVFDAWPVRRAWLFGSVARGAQTEGSDVDLAVELCEDARIGFGIVRLQDELEETFGLDVDIHTVPDPLRTNPATLQGIGWQNWKADGELSGTSGQARRLEAIQVKLTGELATYYEVWYRVHAQNVGWMGWAKNGAMAGTAAHAYRLEAIQVRPVDKGGSAPGSAELAFYDASAHPAEAWYEGVLTADADTRYGGVINSGSIADGRMTVSGNLGVAATQSDLDRRNYSLLGWGTRTFLVSPSLECWAVGGWDEARNDVLRQRVDVGYINSCIQSHSTLGMVFKVDRGLVTSVSVSS